MDGTQEITEFVQKQKVNHHDEEDGPSSWDPWWPPLRDTAQAQLGGVYGNYFLELITVWKLFLRTDFDMQWGYMHIYRCIGKSNVYVIFDCINWRDTLLLGAHDFGGTPRAAQRRINKPTLQSYRLWSLLSAHRDH